jgi:hypothetical protein
MNGRDLRPVAPQQCMDPGGRLTQTEGIGQVVVGLQFQADDFGPAEQAWLCDSCSNSSIVLTSAAGKKGFGRKCQPSSSTKTPAPYPDMSMTFVLGRSETIRLASSHPFISGHLEVTQEQINRPVKAARFG